MLSSSLLSLYFIIIFDDDDDDCSYYFCCCFFFHSFSPTTYKSLQSALHHVTADDCELITSMKFTPKISTLHQPAFISVVEMGWVPLQTDQVYCDELNVTCMTWEKPAISKNIQWRDWKLQQDYFVLENPIWMADRPQCLSISVVCKEELSFDDFRNISYCCIQCKSAVPE